jgi:hypothetical protein
MSGVRRRMSSALSLKAISSEPFPAFASTLRSATSLSTLSLVFLSGDLTSLRGAKTAPSSATQSDEFISARVQSLYNFVTFDPQKRLSHRWAWAGIRRPWARTREAA